MSTPLRILIVDDSADDAELLVRELRRSGYDPHYRQVYSAEDLERALDEEQWDVVVSDHTMPRFSSTAALSILRSRGLDIPFIIVSGTIGEAAAVEAMKAGAQDYVLKDSPARLGPAIRRELDDAAERARRREAEEALRKAERQAMQAEKLRALGQMASGIAHNLNQSLALIAGYSDLALEKLRAPSPDIEAVSEALRVIAQAATDGGDTVRRLLTFARTTPEGEAAPVDLAALVHEVAQLSAPRWRDASQAEGGPIDLIVETEPDTTIEGWGAALRESLTNLIFNAVDAMPEGGTIRLSARRRGGNVEVEVADSGTGMDPEVQARVFEPFFTTKGERGTGLGLAMVAGVVERHGGQIVLRSAPGQGTSIRLVFPSARPKASAPPPPPPARPASSLRVLVVDDEPALARMASLMLEGGGHEVVVATSGEQAVARLEADRFDLVVSDLGMGTGMSGWELARAVHERWPGTRFVLATGWGAQIEPAEASLRGVEAVIAKPYRAADLLRIVAGG